MTEAQQRKAWNMACEAYAFIEEIDALGQGCSEALDNASALCLLLYKPEYTEETNDG